MSNTNDIDALQAALMEAREECVWFISPEQANDFSRVLSALLLERDALKAECNKRFDSVTIKDLLAERNALLKRVAELQEVNRTAVSIISQRDALKQRVAELESQPPAASDRDKALERWMDQVTAMLCHSMTHSHDAKQELVTRCDKAIDAMRKGDSDGK